MRKRLLVTGLAVSAMVHIAAGLLLYVMTPAHAPTTDEPPPLIVDFDIHEAPPPPEAEAPSEPAPPVEPAAAAEEPIPTAPDKPEPPIAEVTIPIDAGVADATPATDAATDAPPATDAAADATPAADAAAVAQASDAGTDATAVAAVAAANDAGAGAGARTAAANDAGPAHAAGSDAGTAVATAADAGSSPGTAARPSSPGVDADLTAYLPPGEIVTVLLRFDRVRGTPWAARTEAILAPMPDYRSLSGQRRTAITDLFEALIISSPRPQDVTATTLIGQSRQSGSALRSFLGHKDAQVAWSTARGGALGRRLPSRLVPQGDQRVFLMPYPNWVILGHPKHMGSLLEPVPGDIDTAAARAEDLPAWLARAPTMLAESGTDQGPVASPRGGASQSDASLPRGGPVMIATVGKLLPQVYNAPYVGPIVTPERVTVTVEIVPRGFFVRGTMVFNSADKAALLVVTAERVRHDFVDSRIGRMVLSRMHIYNALRGLSLEQRGARVGFATSLSVADALAMLDYAASWSRTYFAPDAPAPAPGSEDHAPTPSQPRAPAPPR